MSDRREFPRVRDNIVFHFPGGPTPLTEIPEDASIRSARFPLLSRERIAPFESGEVSFGGIKTAFERMAIPRELVRKAEGTFVVTYKTRQFNVDTTQEGDRAWYKICQFIGAGQSAETYKAEVTAVKSGVDSLATGDSVVIKVPLFVPYLADNEFTKLIVTFNSLLTIEEVSLKRLADLACVASFLDTGSHRFPREGTPTTRFMVQRFVDGHPLGEYLRSKHLGSGTAEFTGLPAHEFYKLGRQLADAVQQVHWKKVIHGDIWPENILVRENGEPVLIDFGQAAFRDAAASIVKVSGRNIRYIAPEEKRTVGGDVYSLGGVLFYLATGEDPPEVVKNVRADVGALTVTVLDRIRLRNKNKSLYQENRGAADIIARCLCMSDERYGDVHTVIERLDTFFAKPIYTAEAVHEAVREVLISSDGYSACTCPSS